jgi:hypothetical protein
MIDLNTYFLQSSSLHSVTSLFKLVAQEQEMAAKAGSDILTISAGGGIRNILSAAVGDSLLALNPTPPSDEDKALPPGWTKYGSPGVRGWETIEEIDDPEIRAMFEYSERLDRPYREALSHGTESLEFRTVLHFKGSELDAVRLDVKAVGDQFGVDSLEYRDAIDKVLNQTDYRRMAIEDLAHAKERYDEALDVLADPTYVRLVSYVDDQGVTRNAVDADGRYISEVTSYTQDELAAAEKIVTDYRQTIAQTVQAIEKRLDAGPNSLTGHVMVQDDTGEFQWSAFRVTFEPTGNYYEWSADGVMNSTNNAREVMYTYAIRPGDDVDVATKTWGIADLKVAKKGYESAKDILARSADEPSPFTEDELTAARDVVDSYQFTMAIMLELAEQDIAKNFNLAGHLMVQDQNGEYQWGTFSVEDKTTSRTYYARSADGTVTSYGRNGEVTGAYALH